MSLVTSLSLHDMIFISNYIYKFTLQFMYVIACVRGTYQVNSLNIDCYVNL
jgi:hypothetical protein